MRESNDIFGNKQFSKLCGNNILYMGDPPLYETARRISSHRDDPSRHTRWRPPKDHRQIQKHVHLHLSTLYKKSRARTFTAMPNRSSGSRCSPAARPCATGTGKSSRPRHFRRGRMRRRREGFSQIGGGLVRLSLVVVGLV